KVTYFGRAGILPPNGTLSGLSQLWPREAQRYRFVPEDGAASLLTAVSGGEDELRHEFAVRDTAVFWRQVAPKWNLAMGHRDIFPGRAAVTKVVHDGGDGVPAGE